MYFSNSKYFNQITSLITALANGQYDKRIHVKRVDNQFATISVLLNMLAGVLKDAAPNLSADHNVRYLNHFIFTITKDLELIDFNNDVIKAFNIGKIRNLKSIVDKDSLKQVKNAVELEEITEGLYLNFKLKEDLFLKMHSRLTISNNYSANNVLYMLSAVQLIKKSEWSKEQLLESSEEKRSAFSITKNRDLIHSLYHYLMDNLDSPPRPIFEIAEKLNTNPTLLKRGFKTIYGTTIAKYHREKRLENAKDLLQDTDTSLYAIAQECGFKSASHFSRAFKKHFGINPCQIR
ncbi:AraC family transcriptional regulator [Christiangramia sp. SM2212]|uniref:AraC family transcriptional regulator n=1 Tax=Christiangramia sediminicola TaxID=3073267 RepID=A0ABU1ESL5_9FLAO|nr:AraC family transcriptional regulator [Christiangramia sp. SM2212]MDR5591143.1 AraC family transcriptional regulator [Christiangramia sp. SM2212]